VPVAILGTPTFDVSAIDTDSLRFGRTGHELSLAFCNPPQDVNNDGLPDLICHFYTEWTGFQAGDTQGILEGKTRAGQPISGQDSVRITR